jgi:hypothetical protein
VAQPRGEGTLEYRTLGGAIPHQGEGQEELLVWTRKGGGALIKIYFKVVVIKCKPYRIGLKKSIKSLLTHSLIKQKSNFSLLNIIYGTVMPSSK